MEIYERLKNAKSKKKKMDLLRECKETLDTEIVNPKLSTETLEIEAFAKIKAKIVTEIVTEPNPVDTPTKKTALDRTKDDPSTSPNPRLPRKKTASIRKTTSTSTPSKMTPTRKMTGKMTMKAKNSQCDREGQADQI